MEKTVEKIHNEFKLKLLEGIVDNLDDKNPIDKNDGSASLNFEKENAGKANQQHKRNTDVYKTYVRLLHLFKFHQICLGKQVLK